MHMEQSAVLSQVDHEQHKSGVLQENKVNNASFLSYVAQLQKRYMRNRKVLLIQTPQFQFESFHEQVAKNRGVYAYPPTGLQCIAKTITSLGGEVIILDLNYHILKKFQEGNFDLSKWLDVLDQYVDLHSPSIIGLTSLTAYNDVLRPAHPLTSILHRLRQRNQQIVVLGGPTATNEYEEYIRQNLCHAVILKEGEARVEYLFGLLFDHPNHLPTSGIAYPVEEKISLTSGHSLKLALKGNLVETYDLIPIENYHQVGSLSPYSRMAGMEKRFSVFQFNRGCRANCKFCDVSKFMGRGVRSYGISEVLQEIEYLVKERGIRHFEILDDDFLGNPLVTELLRSLEPLHRTYGMTWSANNGLIAGSLSEEVLGLLRNSGCIGFRIGIESGNMEMIKKLRKPATLDLLLKRGELINKFPEMFIGANYILGLFGEETFLQMMDTFRFAHRMNLDWASYSTFQFTSKETALIENLKSTGRIATEFTPAKDNARGEIQETEGVVSGPAVFEISHYEIPSPEQVKQIWFTFNLVGNYLCNKNLMPEGNPEKFVSWVEAVRIVYPFNPYMPLFIALGQVVLGDVQTALQNLDLAKRNVAASPYWQHRFDQFSLHDFLIDFPLQPEKVHERLGKLREKYQRWLQP